MPHPSYDKAREAAIEKAKSVYIPLNCGHHTDWETDQVYAGWRPAKNKFFCETCGTWQVRLQPPEREAYPELPLF